MGGGDSPLGRERGNVSRIEGCLEDTSPLCAALAAGWVLLRETYQGGTHPGPTGHPSREGMLRLRPTLSMNGNPLVLSVAERSRRKPVLSVVEGVGWVLLRETYQGGTHPGPTGHPSREGMGGGG